MLRVDVDGDKITVFLGDRPVFAHAPNSPFVLVGSGAGRFSVRGGHWRITDSNSKLTPLTRAQYDQRRNSIRFSGGDYSLTFHISETEGNLVLTPQRATTGLNRVVLHFSAILGQGVYGGGAQYGSLDLRGHLLPLWVHEKRVGRESIRLPLFTGSGHHATFFPQPTFFTQDGMFVHIDSPVYGALDFRSPRHHRVLLWELPSAVVAGVEENIPKLMQRMSRVLGRQPVLPRWCVEGVWLEVCGGAPDLLAMLDEVVSAGASVSALCLRDWSGSRDTKRGPQVFYDWVINQELYPRLDELLVELAASGVRTLAYTNPHISIEGRLFAEASMRGYLIRKPEGGNLLNDMGGLVAGHLDLTNNEACAWYKDIVKNNIFQLGFSGYCADMGNFLPAHAVLHSGESANRMHNRWPVLWAKLNREAIREAGRRATDAVFYSHTGYGGSGGQIMLSSTGEHSAGWGKVDGLPSALNASLTLACSGVGLSFSDIRGQSSPAARGEGELFLRWSEYAAFTPVMRLPLPEGRLPTGMERRPLDKFARLTRIHAKLAPYMVACIKENAAAGIPVMRPLFMEFPEDGKAYHVRDAYMLGRELLVAPVMGGRKQGRRVYLPAGYWIHMWSGRPYMGGEHDIEAPLGQPPVFYKADGSFSDLFGKIMFA
ncbi:MAG: alpha-glucosidase [Oscillospiraceae bacterium]|nr:alpha-glucosidase [Oscillospiraceae bacterium]